MTEKSYEKFNRFIYSRCKGLKYKTRIRFYLQHLSYLRVELRGHEAPLKKYLYFDKQRKQYP